MGKDQAETNARKADVKGAEARAQAPKSDEQTISSAEVGKVGDVVKPEEKVTQLKPGEGPESTPLRQPVQLTYKCDCCGSDFESHRARQGEKLCVNCVELRRALKGFTKRGISAAEVLKRSEKLLEVK